MALSVTAAPELLDFVATGDNDEQEVAIGLLAELAAPPELAVTTRLPPSANATLRAARTIDKEGKGTATVAVAGEAVILLRLSVERGQVLAAITPAAVLSPERRGRPGHGAISQVSLLSPSLATSVLTERELALSQLQRRREKEVWAWAWAWAYVWA